MLVAMDVFTSLNIKTVLPTPGKTDRLKYCVTLALLLLLGACAPIEPPAPPAPEPVVVEPEIVLSADPIKTPSKGQIIFAQLALAKLGYNVGDVDGLWGPRSAREIQTFESTREITSAGGFLSLLNINELKKLSGLDSEAVEQARANNNKSKKSIKAKLEGNLTDTGPQLIILENNYDVFSEPNPYSAKIMNLQAGTGVYIVTEDAGWYFIESINRRKGYVQVD